nr:POTRA domain-containing protein [Flavihumibacter fluvii]
MNSNGPATSNAPNISTVDPAKKLFYIKKITVVGNKHTKDYIIKRELLFKEKDSVVLYDMVNQFELSKEQLINTRLFNTVVINLKSFDGYGVNVEVVVTERWYIFPVPYFNVVDRNFQAWADKGYSISRINYGLKFIHFNTTGRKDLLNLFVISGYSRQLLLSYNQPVADKTLKYGYGFTVGYNAVKEINVKTLNNKQIFLKSDSIEKAGTFLQELMGATFQVNYRPKLRTNHIFLVGYHWNKVDPVVVKVNPTYMSRDSGTSVNYPEFGYAIKYVNADYLPYMQKGEVGEVSLLRKGFIGDVDLWMLRAKGTKAWKFRNNFSYSATLNGVVKVPFDQPYTQQRLFGYGDFYLRGLEKYVIDGAVGAVLNQTFRKQVAAFNFRLPVLSETHNHIPFRIYMKTYADAGISYNKNSMYNPLDNKFLYSAGAGLDIVTLYDLVMRFEYSFNQKGETGFFFHLKNEF